MTGLERDRIDAAIAPLARGTVAALTELSGGVSRVFRLDLTGGVSVVLKIAPDGHELQSARESFVAAHLLDIDVPVTRTLLVDESRQHLPFRFAVTTFLPGVPAATLRGHPDIASLYRQTGAALRRLHSLAMPAFGQFGPQGIIDPVSSNPAHIRRLVDATLAQFAAYGADPRLTLRLGSLLDRHFEAVTAPSRGPVFAHDDLHPGNVLAVEGDDGRLRLSGIIDFGNARAADAVFDLAKCLFCSEHDAPGSTPHILEGYGDIDHPEPERAIRTYTVLHRMIMWWWLRHVGIIPSADAPSDLMDRLRDAADG